MTVSLWRRTRRLGPLRCDCVVVGAGICGTAAALHLRRRGMSVIVVEKDRLGSGASTRNAGFLMRGCADNYALAAREYGRERARTLWRLTEENLAGLRAEGVGSLPGVRDLPSVLLALGESERAELVESVTLMKEDGFRVSWQERGDDHAWRSGVCLGGLVNPDDASCNSREVMEHLRGNLLERESRGSCALHEGQEVFEISEDGGTVTTRTTDAEITSSHVLVCTNAYAPLLLPQLEGVVTPRRGQMLALRAGLVLLHASYYANRGSEYFRQTAGGEVVVGGCRTYHADREVGYEDRTTPWVQGDLERFASLLFGLSIEDVQANVAARWAGTMGFSPTGLPLIVPVNGAASRVWFCGGFTGHGMSMAYRTSEIACGVMVEGAENPFR
ncbi:MAG: FAD-binding oxidoreductase [Phycisphaerales bacterium]